MKAGAKIRQDEYEKIFTELEKIAIVQSVKSSNAIEGIITSDERIKEIVNQNSKPLNHNEKEIAGYRDVLNEIHLHYEDIEFNEDTILKLHEIMMSYTGVEDAGKYKVNQNYVIEEDTQGNRKVRFKPLEPKETPIAMEQLVLAYNDACNNININQLLLIPCVILDFLCIHPFSDGNGRMSRLLTTLLLYQNGFYVGRYISLEAKIAKNKDLYYDALARSQAGWHEGTEDAVPFIKYLLGTILSAYKDFEDRMALVETKLPALEMVRRASRNKIGRFSKQDIRELCPTISDSSIEGALRKLVAVGELEKEGKGKNTCYFRLN